MTEQYFRVTENNENRFYSRRMLELKYHLSLQSGRWNCKILRFLEEQDSSCDQLRLWSVAVPLQHRRSPVPGLWKTNSVVQSWISVNSLGCELWIHLFTVTRGSIWFHLFFSICCALRVFAGIVSGRESQISLLSKKWAQNKNGREEWYFLRITLCCFLSGRLTDFVLFTTLCERKRRKWIIPARLVLLPAPIRQGNRSFAQVVHNALVDVNVVSYPVQLILHSGALEDDVVFAGLTSDTFMTREK